MPRQVILSALEREALLALPENRDDLIRWYTFSEADLADGSVTTCKLFPEMKYARLDQEDVLAIWRGHRAEQLRRALTKAGTPVCARCSQLYLDGM